MKARLLAIAFLSLILVGCPATKEFSGRYVIFNNSGITITELTIAAGGHVQTWEETLSGQGWIYSKSLGRRELFVSWNDDNGDHQEHFSFANKVARNSRADIYVEIPPSGVLYWRVVDPPAEEGAPSTAHMVVVGYVLYVLAVIMVVAVPLAVVALVTYGLYKVGRLVCREVVDGLHGDQSVFQFTIREVLMLTTMVALALGWFFTTRH